MISNKRHIAFIDAYMINGFNATKAYLSAYPNVKYESADASARKLLDNTRIKDEIERRQEENKKKYEVTKEEVVEVVKEIMLNNKVGAPPFSLKAAEILNKMFGFNSADKIELSQNKEQPLFPEDE
jgi:phage terminase small subunit